MASAQPPITIYELDENGHTVGVSVRVPIAPGTFVSRLSTAESIETRGVSWLWQDRIPLRKVTIADGYPGTNKSTLYCAELPARISTGRPMPDEEMLKANVQPHLAGATAATREKQHVVIMSTEDDADDTLVPRLIAAGADLNYVHFARIETEHGFRALRLPDELQVIRKFVEETNAVFVVIDPVMAHLGGGKSKSDTYKDSDMRVVMGGLHAIAADYNCAILIIRHIIKTPGTGAAMYAGGGSNGLIADARAAVMHLRDPDDENRLYLFNTKQNLSRRASSLVYTVESADVELDDGTTGSHPLIKFIEIDPRDGDTLFRDIVHAHRKTGPAPDALDAAIAFIDATLGDGQVVRSKAWTEEAREAHCISERTLDRARAERGVTAKRVDTDGVGVGYWAVYLSSLHLPELEPELEPVKTCACSDECLELPRTARSKYAEGHRLQRSD